MADINEAFAEVRESVPGPSPSAYAGEIAGQIGRARDKLKQSGDRSYIEDAPENAVVLSNRLRFLCAQVGGCQTEQVEAVIRRVLYEVLSGRR